MNEADATIQDPLDDSTLVDLAHELRRLAGDLVKDVRKNAVLPGLSQLAAMKPLQNMLFEALAERALQRREIPGVEKSKNQTEVNSHVGYL